MLTPQQIAETAVAVLSKRIARDIKLIKIEDITVIANYFVICTANSTTQIKNLCDEVEAALEEQGEKLLHREGYRDGGWVLLDYGCVVVHVFLGYIVQYGGLRRVAGVLRRRGA